MIENERQMIGVLGVFFAIPALVIYSVYLLSRFFYSEFLPADGLLLPDSALMQRVLLLGLPILGLFASIYAYGAARDPVSKTGIVLNLLIVVAALAFMVFNYQRLLI